MLNINFVDARSQYKCVIKIIESQTLGLQKFEPISRLTQREALRSAGINFLSTQQIFIELLLLLVVAVVVVGNRFQGGGGGGAQHVLPPHLKVLLIYEKSFIHKLN